MCMCLCWCNINDNSANKQCLLDTVRVSEKDSMAYEDAEREQQIWLVLEAAILSKNIFF